MIESEFLRRASAFSVLYVEDSVTIRHATEKLLQKYFPHLQSATDGKEAFELYRRYHNEHEKNFDIVITDLEMPNMDGRELSRLILEADPDQQIIIISSNENFRDLIALMNIGVKKFLAKPILEEDLFNILTNVVDALFHKQIKAQEVQEISVHNTMLKKREEIYLNKLEKNFKIVSEFNDALNESGIVSKTDPQGIITYVNDKFCTISGYTSDELIGHSHNIIKSGEFSPSFYSKLWHTITQGKSFKGIMKNRAKNGALYYVDALIKPILSTDGEIIEYISIGHDMTPLMIALENEQRAQSQKDQFFNNISHEMRTPLNAILGITSLLKRRNKNDPKLSEMLEVIHTSANNLHQLIESILDIQKIQQNQFEIIEQSFEPLTLFTKLSEQYRLKSDSKQQTLTHSFDPSLPEILLGDSKRLSQAIGIILDNAIKFTPNKGTIEFSVSYETPVLICQIHDNGIGIAKEDHEKIFTLSQLDASITRKHEGAGLGLSIANAIINQMGGTITIHSQPEQGATFLLEIPLKLPYQTNSLSST